MVRSARLGLVAVVAVLGAGACSSAQPDAGSGAPEVASLAKPSASASAAAEQQRPRERLDDTAEDYEALVKPFNDCMEAHGQSKEQQVKQVQGGKELDPKKVKAAQDACSMLEPLPPWEKDPANPESKDFFRDVVKCLKDKGIKYVEVAEGGYALGGEQNDAQSISRGMDLAPECEREVAARN